MIPWQIILNSLAFFALMMATLSFWVKRSFWLWGSFLAIALLLGYEGKLITPIGLAPLALLAASEWLLFHKTKGGARTLLTIIAACISIGLLFHIFPGFHNWKFAAAIELSPDAKPFDFWINFDKPFAGLFLLAWALPLAQSKKEFSKILIKALPLSLLGIGMIIGLSLYLGVVKWDPKLPLLICIWPFVNLFFVVIPEEVFFRGFIQQELYDRFKSKAVLAPVFAISLTALLFTLAHLVWIQDLTFLSLVFIAGVVYGTIYQITKAIEASVLCHFLLNLTHFLFFTYPMLK